MERIIWIDVTILAILSNFVFDYLLLWATAEVSRVPSTRGRLLLAAGLGTLYFAAYLAAQAGLVPYFGLLRFLPVVLLVSLAMLAIAFHPLPLRRLPVVAGYFYLIGFAAAGAGLGVAFAAGSPAEPHLLLGFLVAMATILVLAELGWGVVQRRIWQHVYQFPVELKVGDHSLQLTALVDTGNQLRDPLSGSPVMVVEANAVAHLFPPEVRSVLAADPPDLSRLSQALAGTEWSARFRLIPYHSIDREHGMFVGFRPDALVIRTGNGTVTARKAVVGLCQRRLDPEGLYQALIHPEIIQSGLPDEAEVPVPETSPPRSPRERSSTPHAPANPPL